MRPGLQQSTGLRQELKVNPRLYQAMDLLYMPLLDLQQHLKQELLTNPFLDLVEPEDEDDESADADEVPEAQDLTEPETAVEAEPEKTGDDDVDWEAVLLDGFETGGQREEHEQREWYEPVTVDTKHLSDHLTEQLSLIEMSPREAILADEFAGNISDDGYLSCPLEEIQRGLNEWLATEAEERDAEVLPFSDAEMQAMLAIIQELDPPGFTKHNHQSCPRLASKAAFLSSYDVVTMSGETKSCCGVAALNVCSANRAVLLVGDTTNGASSHAGFSASTSRARSSAAVLINFVRDAFSASAAASRILRSRMVARKLIGGGSFIVVMKNVLLNHSA
jgi:RNA polymerase sigma-54 factor